MSDNKSGLSRRGFLSAATSGLVTAGLLKLSPAAALAQGVINQTGESQKDIICRTLGRTGLQVPIIGMGVMNAENPEMVRASYEIGVRYFNLSGNYQLGRVETVVGGVINRLKIRDKVVVGTGTLDVGDYAGLSTAECKKKMTAACEASLRRLGMDYIDIYYIYEAHDPGIAGYPSMIEAVENLKQQQKIRYAGVSMHSNMAAAINAVANDGYFDVVMTTINFTLADDTDLLNAIKSAADKGIGVVAMKIMAGGSRWPNPESRKDYTSSTIATACLKWVLQNENIATSVPGYMNFEHMREDFSVAGSLEYTSEEEKFLGDNSVRLGMGFCRQCKKCLATCPSGVDIPTLMRVHMYAAQYADFHHARATLDGIPRDSDLKKCNDCPSCAAACANTVDIASRIDELKTIYA